MAKAKSTPVVKKEKPITLTKEQYSKLCEIKDSIDNVTDYLKEIADDTDKEDTIKIGFLIGRAYNVAINSWDDLKDIVWNIQPDNDDNEDEFEF
jgi:hypothetical protein